MTRARKSGSKKRDQKSGREKGRTNWGCRACWAVAVAQWHAHNLHCLCAWICLCALTNLKQAALCARPRGCRLMRDSLRQSSSQSGTDLFAFARPFRPEIGHHGATLGPEGHVRLERAPIWLAQQMVAALSVRVRPATPSELSSPANLCRDLSRPARAPRPNGPIEMGPREIGLDLGVQTCGQRLGV